MPDATFDQIEAAKARDKRLRDIEASIDVETALRAGGPLRAVMELLRYESDKAMEDFAIVNPADTQAVIGIQARVVCFTAVLGKLNFILQRGQAAEQSLRAEDRIDAID